MTLDFQNTSRMVSTRDGKIHYNEAGEGHPVVLLHGSGPGATGWSNFAPNVDMLAKQFRVLAVDMPGWGRSAAVTRDDRDHVEAAVRFLDELGIDKAAFVGNSMGGTTTLNFAVRHPDRISHAVTMGTTAPPPAVFSAAGGPSEGLKVLFHAYDDPSPKNISALVDVMTFDSGFATDELIAQRSEAARANPDHLRNFIEGRHRPTRVAPAEDLIRINVPTLLFHGRDDRVVNYENSLRLVSLIPDSRLVVINRCGHWLQIEHADEFNRTVAEFITAN